MEFLRSLKRSANTVESCKTSSISKRALQTLFLYQTADNVSNVIRNRFVHIMSKQE